MNPLGSIEVQDFVPCVFTGSVPGKFTRVRSGAKLTKRHPWTTILVMFLTACGRSARQFPQVKWAKATYVDEPESRWVEGIDRWLDCLARATTRPARVVAPPVLT